MDRNALKDHGVWPALSDCEERLRDCEEWLDNSPTAIQVRWALPTLRSHDDPGDTGPYAKQTLDAIQATLAQIQSALDQVRAQESAAYLSNADAPVDQLTVQLAALPLQSNRDPARIAGRTFADYREATEQALQSLREQREDAEYKLAQHQEAQAAQQVEYESKVTALEEELRALSSQVKDQAERARKQLTDVNETFNEAQTKRQQRFEEWLEEQAEALDVKAMDDLSQVTSMKRRGEERLRQIEQLHEDVEKVSGKAAAAILAKDYGSYSTREWVSGVVAYVCGFGVLIALAAYLLVTVTDVAKDEAVSWQYVALKLGLTVSAIAASGVAFQFGSHALSRAATNKRVQLELGTIGTFLSDVGDEEAVQKAKLDFVNRMFGRAWDDSTAAPTGDEVVSANAVSKIADAFHRVQNGG